MVLRTAWKMMLIVGVLVSCSTEQADECDEEGAFGVDNKGLFECVGKSDSPLVGTKNKKQYWDFACNEDGYSIVIKERPDSADGPALKCTDANGDILIPTTSLSGHIFCDEQIYDRWIMVNKVGGTRTAYALCSEELLLDVNNVADDVFDANGDAASGSLRACTAIQTEVLAADRSSFTCQD